jgi:hypothetical protein
MSRKKDGDEIKRVSASDSTKRVKATDSVSEVERVTGTKSVSGVSGVSRVKQTSGVNSISFEQREKLFSMVQEEAQKLAAQGIIPPNQREIVERSVKMILDGVLLDPLDEGAAKNKK